MSCLPSFYVYSLFYVVSRLFEDLHEEVQRHEDDEEAAEAAQQAAHAHHLVDLIMITMMITTEST